MNTVQKLALVPSELVTHHAAGQLDTQMGQLDRDMKLIIDSTHIPEDIKAKLYQDKLTKYLAAQEVKKKPIPVPVESGPSAPPAIPPGIPPAPAPPGIPPAALQPLDRTTIIRGIPRGKTEFANRLIDFLDNHRDTISWNANKELMVGTRPIVGSSIKDLVHAASRDTLREPTGWRVFRQQLTERGIPREAIGSRHFDRLGGPAPPKPAPLAQRRLGDRNKSPMRTRVYTPSKKKQQGRGLPWLTLYK